MTKLALNNVRPYGEDVTSILIDVEDGVIDSIGDNPFDLSLIHISEPTRPY